MANVERCAKCNAVIALVGIRHNCNPVFRGGVDGHAGKETGAETPRTNPTQGDPGSPAGAGTEKGKAGVKPSPRKAYRYRDPDKRRAYMRNYMKRRRALPSNA